MLELDRWRLYHWYFETFQRMLLGGVNKTDQRIIKELIKDAYQSNTHLSKQYQNTIKAKLSRDYHRSSFSIAFNNQKRQVLKELRIVDSVNSYIVEQRSRLDQLAGNSSTLSAPATPQLPFPSALAPGGKHIVEFMQEPSTTTHEYLSTLNEKVQAYNEEVQNSTLENEEIQQLLL